MEKNHRLFLRNLPPDIGKKKLEKLFEHHGRVTNVDVKEKVQSDGSRIAFVNLSTTDRQLNACFQAINGKILNGNAISVEVAKESYLERLKRERDEAANKKEASNELKFSADQYIEKINIKIPVNIKTEATKRIYNFEELERNYDEATEDPTDESGNFAYDPALEAVAEVKCLKKTMEIKGRVEMKKESVVIKAPENNKKMSESETKRLASVTQKRQTFKAKERLISNALKAVDSGRNKKIIFSGDIEKKISRDGGKISKCLFNDDDDAEDDQADWNGDQKLFHHDEKRSAKLAMSMNYSGRDNRFAINERFLDDYDNGSIAKAPEKKYDDEMNDETQWQLEILQDVLGKPIKARNEKLYVKKDNKMVRYDPTASGHQAHELEMTHKPPSKAQKRKLAANETTQEQTPIPISSKVFYSVSDNLADTLNVQEEFSLLKTFGTAAAADKNRIDEYDASANAAQENWQRNFNAKNPFKYESSDDEGSDPTIDQLTRNVSDKSKMQDSQNSYERNDTLFFEINDQRFRDAEEFFNKTPPDTENFNSVRRELKMIVRKKVRNNVNKRTLWKNKKIGRIPKSR